MISRIARVKNYRGLQDWSCNGSVADFAAVNVVYGFNGSGKSTLCSLFRDAPADEGWTTGLELEITETGIRRTVRSSSDPFWQRIRVFNRDYVESNLKFDEADPTAIPLLVLGERQVGIESRRLELQSRLDVIDERLLDLQRERTTADNSLRALLKTTADTIVAELQHLEGRYHPRSFNAGSVCRRLSDGFTAPPAGTDVNALLGVVREQQLGAVTLPPRTTFSLDRLIDDVRAVLAETATSQVVDDLRLHPDWNRWVQEGLALHAQRNTCIYCTGSITAKRQEALAHHFDESLHLLQNRISNIDSELASERETCARAVASLPADEHISPELRAAFYAARTAVGIRANRWMDVIDAVLLGAALIGHNGDPDGHRRWT